MNLLFYIAASKKKHKFGVRDWGFSSRQESPGRPQISTDDAKKLLLFFRYFAPNCFRAYISNTSHHDTVNARTILAVFPEGTRYNDFLLTSFNNGPFLNCLLALLRATGATNISSIIDRSFTWAHASDFRDLWPELNSLLGMFCRLITRTGVTMSHSLSFFDNFLYPLLRGDRALGPRVVQSSELLTVSQTDDNVVVEQEAPRRRRRSIEANAIPNGVSLEFSPTMEYTINTAANSISIGTTTSIFAGGVLDDYLDQLATSHAEN